MSYQRVDFAGSARTVTQDPYLNGAKDGSSIYDVYYGGFEDDDALAQAIAGKASQLIIFSPRPRC